MKMKIANCRKRKSFMVDAFPCINGATPEVIKTVEVGMDAVGRERKER